MGWAARLNNARERAHAAGYKKPERPRPLTTAQIIRALASTHVLTRPVRRAGGVTITKVAE